MSSRYIENWKQPGFAWHPAVPVPDWSKPTLPRWYTVSHSRAQTSKDWGTAKSGGILFEIRPWEKGRCLILWAPMGRRQSRSPGLAFFTPHADGDMANYPPMTNDQWQMTRDQETEDRWFWVYNQEFGFSHLLSFSFSSMGVIKRWRHYRQHLTSPLDPCYNNKWLLRSNLISWKIILGLGLKFSPKTKPG